MRKLPFSNSQIKELVSKHKTPFYIYDERGITAFSEDLQNAFSWVNGFGYKNYFAVKALPNPNIVKLLYDLGMGVDTSSMAELVIAERLGIRGEDIMFTANNVPIEEFEKARALGAIINFDDITHLDFYYKHFDSMPETVCFRYNPGALKEGNEIIGNPLEAKYGLTKEQLFEAYASAKEYGAKRFGLHTMIVSNMLDVAYHQDTAKILFELAVELKNRLDIDLEFVNLGGGLGIPYKPDEKPVDLEVLSRSIQREYERVVVPHNLSFSVVTEYGRAITGPYGYLVTAVLHTMQKYKKYIGVDASMSNLMRPALYGAYHHIVVLEKDNNEPTETCDVVGSLCENNDKFAIDRLLPKIKTGDILVICDVGAHGHAMGFQYNGKLRSAEFLLTKNGEFKQIRRAETLDDYFATVNLLNK